jgi:hypothetical protein
MTQAHGISDHMTRVISIIGLIASLAMIFAAYVETPEAASVESAATETLGEGCVIREVALDEGYGVTRMEKHIVCPKERIGADLNYRH